MNRRSMLLAICAFLAVAPLLWIATSMHEYPAVPFGGGGGSAFSAPSQAACGPLCEAIIAWLIDKGLTYVSSNASNPAGCGGPNSCPADPYGLNVQ